MVRVRAVLKLATGKYIEYVSPRMNHYTANDYVAELKGEGHMAEKIYEFAKPLTVREIVASNR
jgi:hypothetical protein